MYTLRPATEDDFTFLYNLHVATMKEYVDQIWGWDDAVQQRMFKNDLDIARCKIVVVDNRDMGVVMAERRQNAFFIDHVEILPEYQNRGIGTKIISDILSEAGRCGLPVALRVFKISPAKRLYERLGFSVVGQDDTHFLMQSLPS